MALLLKFVRLMELWFVSTHYRQVIRTFGMLALHGRSDQLHASPVLTITKIQGWLSGFYSQSVPNGGHEYKLVPVSDQNSFTRRTSYPGTALTALYNFQFLITSLPSAPHIPLSTLLQNTLTAIDCHRLAYGWQNEVHNRVQDCTGRSMHCTVACENGPWGHATRVVTTVSHKPYKTWYLPDSTLRTLSLLCYFVFFIISWNKQEIVEKT